MKLRIQDNSIRLRLRQSEVEQLRLAGSVEGRVKFSGGTLTYRLAANADVDSPAASFQDGMIEVLVPAAAAQHWTSSEDVAITGEQQATAGLALSILIEKDFRCMHKEGDSPDAYPNPLLASQ